MNIADSGARQVEEGERVLGGGTGGGDVLGVGESEVHLVIGCVRWGKGGDGEREERGARKLRAQPFLR